MFQGITFVRKLTVEDCYAHKLQSILTQGIIFILVIINYDLSEIAQIN